MNDKTREQIEAMKNQTIGVEIEMNNITREKAARKVAEYFGTRAWNAAGEYGYYSWACKDGQGRVWKFQRDVSIYGPDAEKCELVTPILTYDDIETLQEIIRLLRFCILLIYGHIRFYIYFTINTVMVVSSEANDNQKEVDRTLFPLTVDCLALTELGST